MIHQQGDWYAPRYYAYCNCGICGPLRVWRKNALRDEIAHANVCSTKGRAT